MIDIVAMEREKERERGGVNQRCGGTPVRNISGA